MEDLEVNGFNGVYKGKTVLVTGHTGFKGSWLCLWLSELGAKVSGLALAPEGIPNLYNQLGLKSIVDSRLGDIRDPELVRHTVSAVKPDIIFHLAAQPLVRRSYRQPRETFETNVMGTINVLEAARAASFVKVCQIVTTDKCYQNDGGSKAFRETDPLGGHDPYSASKACAEIAVGAYRDSGLCGGMSVSTVRAGNVIGGGDWSEDRIIPDCIRALSKKRPIEVRNPAAIRPWQFVLESASGYLSLASRQWEDPERFAGAWNFGPDPERVYPVREVVEKVVKLWGEGQWKKVGSDATLKEAPALSLDPSKARKQLGWNSVYGLDEALSETVRWYKASFSRGFPTLDFSRKQIGAFASAAGSALRA